MPVTSDPPVSDPALAHEKVRAELERILASTAFRNSKRFTGLFRHLIERTLQGRQAELKERLIGVDVFGRPADYDTNSDPIVRTSVGELRKRIAQYYHGTGQESEVRIDVPIGSYVPEVHILHEARQTDALLPVPATGERSKISSSRAIFAASLGAFLIVASFLGWHFMAKANAAERFWRPVLEPNSTVALCVGATQSSPASSQAANRAEQPAGFAFADVAVATKLAGLLGGYKQPFQLQRIDETTLDSLRRGPAIFVGALNDIWTLRVTDALRFSFHREGERVWVQDAQNRSSQSWVVDLSKRNTLGRIAATRDYAVISRLLKARTGQPVITIGGILGYGTEIAGDYVANPSFLTLIANRAPAGWESMSGQIVISTEVIDQHAGPPEILATYFWR